MASVMVQITHGPEHPTRAALGFLVAKAALDEGHSVTVFLAGDAVAYMREPIRESVTGVGTGNVKEHFDALSTGGAKFYLSGMSSKARGITPEMFGDVEAEMALPNKLVQLALDHDRVFTY